MTRFSNPFRPGAGHAPPHLAGRLKEREELCRLLEQRTILENMILTGLRGVGKTVLLDSFKPLAVDRNWVWVGADLSESASIDEDKMAIRLCTDLSLVTSQVIVDTKQVYDPGFTGPTETVQHTLNYQKLIETYRRIPGLALDKLKGVLEIAWRALSNHGHFNGIVFAYDEAQNLADQPARGHYPLSLLLDCFQSLQRRGLPLMLILAGLPTLFPKLVDARTYSERMFRVVFLQSLARQASEEAIRKPIDDASCPVRLSDDSVRKIIDMSGGYPYFIQFICREVYDALILQVDSDDKLSVPVAEIEQKLDSDFFAGRWARATDRQRELLFVISGLESCHDEFTVQEIVGESKRAPIKPFGSSHVNQMLVALAAQGLVYKNRHGKYSFAIPMLGRFIRRQQAPWRADSAAGVR